MSVKIVVSEKDIERFWSKVDVRGVEDCWEWLAGKRTGGYGVIRIKSKSCAASRVSWILHNGEIADGLCICHKCDNPACVNPNHLFLGTYKDNAQDMVAKGRQGTCKAKGEKSGRSKLSEKQVIEIREKYITFSPSIRQLAKEYCVPSSTLYDIISYITWKHI